MKIKKNAIKKYYHNLEENLQQTTKQIGYKLSVKVVKISICVWITFFKTLNVTKILKVK